MGGGWSKQNKHSKKNIFWIPRHSLLRNQIFSLISKGFRLSLGKEIKGQWRWRQCFLEIFRVAMACIGIFFFPGIWLFFLCFEHPMLSWGGSFEEEANWFHWIYLEKYKHTPFPVRLISQTPIVWLTRFDTKWAKEERHPVIPGNIFLLLLKYLLVVSLKNLKQIKLY